jgi:S-formylglutathione hydrolase FrmB
VYLPPGYHEDPGRRYPVLYLLHGYGADTQSPIVGTRDLLRRNVPLPLRLLFARLLRRALSYERLDALIGSGSLPPFILVQPDGSLQLPQLNRLRRADGTPGMKGSFYSDSPFSGAYTSYIFGDVVDYVDAHYRTRAERGSRALIGGSMGGYGALLGGILHPERFESVAALSPAVGFLELLELQLVVPVFRRLLGRRRAERLGRLEVEDIADTCDLVFSRDRPLVPTVRRDSEGKVLELDMTAAANWDRADLCRIVAKHAEALKGVRVQINCEQSDEYGFAATLRCFHRTLGRLGIAHEFEVYSDPALARYSPHALGIACHVLPAFRFCLQGVARAAPVPSGA